jgi:hypothetical protein
MAIDSTAPRSRRAILAGALGGVGALVAHSLSRATPVAAANNDPVLLGKGNGLGENEATASTRISSTVGPTLEAHALLADVAFKASSQTARAIQAVSASGLSLEANSTAADGTGLLAHAGDGSALAADTTFTGAYGFAEDATNFSAAGIWGDTLTGFGVVGTGDWGVFGLGYLGVVGTVSDLAADVGSVGVTGTSAGAYSGVYGFAGDSADPGPVAKAGVSGRAGTGASYGVVAAASASNQFGLYVAGRLRVSASAGGRTSFTSTATSKKITLAGITASSFVIATLQTSVSGCYVRNVVCGAGYFYIYLSKAPGKTAYVGYIVAN